ncbi:unnamed protein product [Lampetra planeri]
MEIQIKSKRNPSNRAWKINPDSASHDGDGASSHRIRTGAMEGVDMSWRLDDKGTLESDHPNRTMEQR